MRSKQEIELELNKILGHYQNAISDINQSENQETKEILHDMCNVLFDRYLAIEREFAFVESHETFFNTTVATEVIIN